MPHLKFTEAAPTSCNCNDGRNFAFPVVRKHFTTEGGDVWCCVFHGEGKHPSPLVPVSGEALTEWEQRKAAKTAAKAAAVARKAVVDSFEAKRVELKAKVDEGGTLSNDDLRDFVTLLIQIPG